MDEPDDFVGFLNDLIEGEDLEGASAGIAARAVADGSIRQLTAAQHAALVVAVKEWIGNQFSDYEAPFVHDGETPPPPDCTDCSNSIPWCEVYIAGTMNDGHCSWCEQVHHKDD